MRKCPVGRLGRPSPDTVVAYPSQSEKSSSFVIVDETDGGVDVNDPREAVATPLLAGITCPLALLARWRYLPAGVARPLALLARWHYLPADVTCPLALLARWRYLPAGVACPLALLARWRCSPASVTDPLALLACWRYLPAGAARPLALLACWCSCWHCILPEIDIVNNACLPYLAADIQDFLSLT